MEVFMEFGKDYVANEVMLNSCQILQNMLVLSVFVDMFNYYHIKFLLSDRGYDSVVRIYVLNEII